MSLPVASTPSSASAATTTAPTTLWDHTTVTAPFNVIRGTAAFTVLGGLTGSFIGVIRNLPALPAGFATGVNTGLFSFSFFALREYAITPLLILSSLHPNPLIPDGPPPNPHFHNLLPTSLAGLTAGTFFSYFMRGGSRGALRAGGTLSMGCTAIQMIVNEAEVVRVGALLRAEDRRRTEASLRDHSAPVELGQTGEGRMSLEEKYRASRVAHDPKTETFADRSDRLFGEAWASIKSTVGNWSPIKKMDKDEYERKLQERLNALEREREETRREREILERKLERATREL